MKALLLVTIVGLGLVLAACKKEQREVTVTFAGGVPVFDGARSECIMSVRVGRDTPPPDFRPTWEASAPLPITNDETCPWRFPVRFDQLPPTIRTYPERRPAFESGRLYSVFFDGMGADHSGQFRAP